MVKPIDSRSFCRMLTRSVSCVCKERLVRGAQENSSSSSSNRLALADTTIWHHPRSSRQRTLERHIHAFQLRPPVVTVSMVRRRRRWWWSGAVKNGARPPLAVGVDERAVTLFWLYLGVSWCIFVFVCMCVCVSAVLALWSHHDIINELFNPKPRLTMVAVFWRSASATTLSTHGKRAGAIRFNSHGSETLLDWYPIDISYALHDQEAPASSVPDVGTFTKSKAPSDWTPVVLFHHFPELPLPHLPRP